MKKDLVLVSGTKSKLIQLSGHTTCRALAQCQRNWVYGLQPNLNVSEGFTTFSFRELKCPSSGHLNPSEDHIHLQGLQVLNLIALTLCKLKVTFHPCLCKTLSFFPLEKECLSTKKQALSAACGIGAPLIFTNMWV